MTRRTFYARHQSRHSRRPAFAPRHRAYRPSLATRVLCTIELTYEYFRAQREARALSASLAGCA